MRRVVVTGMGVISPVGNDIDTFWRSVKKGAVAIGPITKFDTEDFSVKLAAEVKDFAPETYMEKKETKRMDIYCQYALNAAGEAAAMADIAHWGIPAQRFGVIVGSGIGGLETMEAQIIKMHEKGPKRVGPLFIPMSIANLAAGNIAIRYGAQGICTAVVTACATGANCIGEAFRQIKYGMLDGAIAGGAEGSITRIGIAGFTSLTALSQAADPLRASIPFDLERNGFVMGEGAGIFVLEELAHALDRGAEIYGEIAGYGANCDAYHMTSPSPEGAGAAKAMGLAMGEAGVGPEEIGYINAHGTGTQANDVAETKAIKTALGAYAGKVAVSSTKSMMGHLLGAAGAVEGVVCLKALAEGYIPPTVGIQVPDPQCDLDYTPGVGKNKDIQYALSNSLGFGGHNAVLCFKKWEGR